MGELVTLVDNNDRMIGSKERSHVSDNARWRISLVWVTDKTGNVLIVKRALDKKIQPGLWEPGASGTVTYGDSYEQTAHQELYEELGIKRVNLVAKKVIYFKSTFGSRALALFRTIVDRKREKIKIQTEEISEIKWIAPKDLEEDHLKHPEKYTIIFGQLLEYFK